MKRMIIIVTTVCLCYGSLHNTNAQTRRKQAETLQQTGSTQQKPDEIYVFRREGNSSTSTGDNGEGVKLVEGRINGRIVLRVDGEKGKDGKYIFGYVLLDGEYVYSIDASGISGISATLIFLQGYDRDNPDDAAVVQKALSARGEGILGGTAFENKALLYRLTKDSIDNVSGTLLGEYTSSKIIPEITITAKNGVVKIPVKSFIKFKEKTKELK